MKGESVPFLGLYRTFSFEFLLLLKIEIAETQYPAIKC